MKLFYSPTSPSARKVRIVIDEIGIPGVRPILVNPFADPGELNVHNPLDKVPALVTDAGETLYDSPVICEYLDAQFGGQLFPEGAARWPALRTQALTDGIMDAVVAIRLESLRPPERRLEPTRSLAAVQRGLAAIAPSPPNPLEHGFTIAHIGVICALGYLDLRLSAHPWREAHPNLGAWYATMLKRPSVHLTRHPN